jgi:hypothetical protein
MMKAAADATTAMAGDQGVMSPHPIEIVRRLSAQVLSPGNVTWNRPRVRADIRKHKVKTTSELAGGLVGAYLVKKCGAAPPRAWSGG